MHPNERQKLDGIEALRGVAAVCVVLYHAARHLHQAYGADTLMRLFQPGHGGVDLFFVLSGFIILHVHRGDIGRPERLANYARRRFVRLMPIYWIALGLTALAIIAAGKAVSPGFLVWSASLLPTYGEPLLGIAWTLQHELMFYAVFALLILNRTLGLAVIFVWLGWIAMSWAGIVDLGPVRISNGYNLEFFFGMGAAAVVASEKVATPRLLAALGMGLILFNGAAESLGWLDGYGMAARWTGGLSAAVLICGLVAWERRYGMRVPAILRALGSASYAIYLFQFLGMAVAWQVWVRAGLDRPQLAVACFGFMALAGVIGGIVMSRLVEQPLLARMRKKRGERVVGSAAPI